LTDLHDVFNRQVDAFNAHDLEGFLATYADDAVIVAMPPAQPLVGRDALREHYAQRLADPAIHCEVLDCAVFGGGWLVALERVASVRATTDVLAVFEIARGLITRSTNLQRPAARDDDASLLGLIASLWQFELQDEPSAATFSAAWDEPPAR
jgi:uncharacterized protein (TIGR02246 family)